MTINQNTLSAGASLFLGRYPQTEQGALQPIEWQVLDVQEERVLVLSRFVLDAMPFHNESGSIRWEDCSLRGWLNDVFMNAAFTAEEQEAICMPAAEEDPMGDFLWQLFGLETATSSIADRVFLLSHADILQYYPEESGNNLFCPGASAQCTPYVELDDCCWWLRSSSSGIPMAHIISPVDSIGMSAINADNQQGVRPAMWLHRSACQALMDRA